MSTYLILGATGKSGIAVVKSLVTNPQNKVQIVVRNMTKAKDIFKAEYEKIEKVVEYEFGKSDKDTDIENAVKNADYIVSALGPSYGKDNPLISDYIATKKMIELSEKSSRLKKYIYISSLFVTRPYHPISFILNTLVPYCLGYKALSENLFRKSKNVNYIIVRPGGLTDTTEINYVKVDQGDRMNGRITRTTLGKFVTDLIEKSPTVSRTTIDIISEKRDYVYELPNSLRADDFEKDYITSDHFNATKNMTIVLYTIFVIILVYLMAKFL
jgi:nucleoside-diphosphate-sugar epimerase